MEWASRTMELGNDFDAIKFQADLNKVESRDKIVEVTHSASGDHNNI